MKLNIDVNEIIRLYVEEQLPISEIAKMYGVNHSTIRLRLVRNDIEIRSIKETQKIAMDKKNKV